MCLIKLLIIFVMSCLRFDNFWFYVIVLSAMACLIVFLSAIWLILFSVILYFEEV